MREAHNLSDFEKRISLQKLRSMAVTTYDFHNAMKRIGPSVRR